MQRTRQPVGQGSGKVDFQVSQRIRAFGRYSWRDANINSEAALPLPSGSGGNFTCATTRQIALGTTFVQSNRSVLEVRFGWSSVHGLSRGFSWAPPVRSKPTHISGLPDDRRISGGLPTQIINGYTNLGRGAANPRVAVPIDVESKVNYTHLARRHSIKVGVNGIHMAQEVPDINPLYGSNTFAGQFTRPTGAAANNAYNVADFLLGLRSQCDLTNFSRCHRRSSARHALPVRAGRHSHASATGSP